MRAEAVPRLSHVASSRPEIGVGHTTDARGRPYYVQVFARPVDGIGQSD